MRHQSFDLHRVTAILLEQTNFGPNVIYYVFWESGGPSADDVDLEFDLRSTSGRPQVNLWYLPTHLTHLPQVDLKSTSGRLGSLPRRHRSQCLHMTNGTWPHGPRLHKYEVSMCGQQTRSNNSKSTEHQNKILYKNSFTDTDTLSTCLLYTSPSPRD